MRGVLLTILLVAGCIEGFEAPELEDCVLSAPESVAIGEPFTVAVQCIDQAPAWFDYDFGDSGELVRSAANARDHSYGEDAADHLWFRVQVFYPDSSGTLQRLETRIDRRFD